jgi:uncharacterized membrane protein required for colicin V production
MLDLAIAYFFLIGIFGVIGYLRGWQREVVAMAGLVASMAALSQFAYLFLNALHLVPPPGPVTPEVLNQRATQFWLQAMFHTMIAFFSYQLVGRLADIMTRGRFGERLRSGLEARITGMLFGLLNGYLYIGALWGFLEYLVSSTGYQRLPPGEPYPFGGHIISRPVAESMAYAVAGWLPQHFSPTTWLIAFFIVFFIVLIALI